MREKYAISVLRNTFVLSCVAGLLLAGVQEASATVGLHDRESDPVVIKGADAPKLVGVLPGDVVAFRYDNGWTQVPVQVDERKWADYRVIRRQSMDGPQFGAEVYADSKTWTEADGVPQRYWDSSLKGQSIPGTTGDPNLDADDEIAMMTMDSGSIASGAAPPAGVDDKSRTPVKVSDPLDASANSYFYLFKRTSNLDPAAGADYASYVWQFSPALSPPYKTDPGPAPDPFISGYSFGGIDDKAIYPPANPEASSVTTANYEQTFPGKWLVDGLKIKEGGASGVDILDGDKSMVGVSSCSRNELTFSRGAGGFVANIDGPVRVIRSYIGANSGTYTQRDQIYYSDRVDTNTYLRVHIGITDFVMATDYSEAAFGMTYRNDLNEAGVTMDGVPDNVAIGQLSWEQATGAQGTVTNVGRIVTDVPANPILSYYQDNMSPPGNDDAIICSGDSHAIGASGPRITFLGAGENTDPTLQAPTDAVLRHFYGHRVSYYDPPNEPVSTSKLRARQVDSPVTFVTGQTADPASYEPKTSVRLILVKPRKAVRPGNLVKVKVTVKNTGKATIVPGKLCPKANAKQARTFGCKAVGRLRPGKSSVRRMPVKVKKGKGHGSVKVKFQYRAGGKVYSTAGIRIRVVRKG